MAEIVYRRIPSLGDFVVESGGQKLSLHHTEIFTWPALIWLAQARINGSNLLDNVRVPRYNLPSEISFSESEESSAYCRRKVETFLDYGSEIPLDRFSIIASGGRRKYVPTLTALDLEFTLNYPGAPVRKALSLSQGIFPEAIQTYLDFLDSDEHFKQRARYEVFLFLNYLKDKSPEI